MVLLQRSDGSVRRVPITARRRNGQGFACVGGDLRILPLFSLLVQGVMNGTQRRSGRSLQITCSTLDKYTPQGTARRKQAVRKQGKLP